MRLRCAGVLLAALLAAAACSDPSPSGSTESTEHVHDTPLGPVPSETTPPTPSIKDPLPGMPPVIDPHNVDASAGAGMLSPAVAGDKPLVYVPHSKSGDVWVIDPATFKVVAKYPVGKELQHVVPSWDLRTLYATDDLGDVVMPFDAHTGQAGQKFHVVDPYNMYFT